MAAILGDYVPHPLKLSLFAEGCHSKIMCVFQPSKYLSRNLS